MMSADVSVVIPCYNAEASIERALLSVAAQSVQPREVVCVDDGSTDTTQKRLCVLQSRLPDLNIRIITNAEQRGPAHARNSGWNSAVGKYIAFLDADDSWMTTKIECQVAFMENNAEASLTGHRVVIAVHADSSPPIALPNSSPRFEQVRLRQLLLSNCFLTPSVMLRRGLPMRFNESLRYCEDYHLWCKVVASNYSAFWSSIPLACVHKQFYGSSGLSGDMRAMAQNERLVYELLSIEKRLSRSACMLLKAFSIAKSLFRNMRVEARRHFQMRASQ